MNESQVQVEAPDVLANVELEIARRADELSRDRRYAHRHPLDHWRQAEEEVWLDRWQERSGPR
jgi:hypothetical protein